MNGMGKKLRQLRGDRKQSEIAAEISRNYQPLASSSYAMYENDQREPNFNTLIALADFYGVSTDFLLGRSECSSVSEDIQSACVTTGLSEETVKKLIEYSNDKAISNFYVGKGKLFLIDTFAKSEFLEKLVFEICQYAIAKEKDEEFQRDPNSINKYIEVLAATKERFGHMFTVSNPTRDLSVQEYNLYRFGGSIMEEYKKKASCLFEICRNMSVEEFSIKESAIASKEKTDYKELNNNAEA